MTWFGQEVENRVELVWASKADKGYDLMEALKNSQVVFATHPRLPDDVKQTKNKKLASSNTGRLNRPS